MIICESSEIILRAFCAKDFNFCYQLLSNPKIMKNTGFRLPQSEEETRKYLNEWIDFSDKEFGKWLIEDKLSGESIGWIMLKELPDNFCELGYMISESFWGMGYATKACNLIFKKFNLEQPNRILTARVDENNKASINVLHKMGMVVSKIDEENKMKFYELKK